MPPLKLPPASIKVDPEVVPRDSKSSEVVQRYADVIRRGGELPRPVVFFDGKTNWLADGLYRLRAHKDLELENIVCDLRKGSREDAIWYAAGANREHGMPLTSAEKRRAAENVLRTPSLADRSDSVIGDQTGYTGARIQQIRAGLVKDGKMKKRKTVTDSTGKKRKPAKQPKKQPDSSATTAASKSGPKLKDGLGKPVPDWGREFVSDLKPINDWLTKLSALAKDYAALRQIPAGSQLDAVVCSTLDEIANTVQHSKFFCICEPCREAENIRKSCTTCKGRGWLSREQYDKTLEQK